MNVSVGMRVGASNDERTVYGEVWRVVPHGDHQHVLLYADDGGFYEVNDHQLFATTTPRPVSLLKPLFKIGERVFADFTTAEGVRVRAHGTVERWGATAGRVDYLIQTDDFNGASIVTEDELSSSHISPIDVESVRDDDKNRFLSPWLAGRMSLSPYTFDSVVNVAVGFDGKREPAVVVDHDPEDGSMVVTYLNDGSSGVAWAEDGAPFEVLGLYTGPLATPQPTKYVPGQVVHFAYRDIKGIGRIYHAESRNGERVAYAVDCGPDQPLGCFIVEDDITAVAGPNVVWHSNSMEVDKQLARQLDVDDIVKPDTLEERVATLEREAQHRREYYEDCRARGIDYESRLTEVERELDRGVLADEPDAQPAGADEPLVIEFSLQVRRKEDGKNDVHLTAHSNRDQRHDELRMIAHGIMEQIGDPSPYAGLYE